MKFLKIAKKDISSIFHNRMIRVSVVAIIIVPLLYSLLYLAAFWDPYSRMDKLPIAVVNLDKGANNDGEYENAGTKLVDELKNNNDVGWRFVSLKEAEDGLDKDGYYSMFVIPEDFSKKIMSAKDGNPEQSNIKFVPNDKKNFLASQIGGKVQEVLKGKIKSTIAKQYTEVTFDNLFEVKDGMRKATDGSQELADGNQEMLDGVTKLTDKIPEMQDGVGKLADGAGQINTGVGQLKDKVNVGVDKASKVDFNKILNYDNLKKAQLALAEGQKVANMDTSMLDMVNANTLNLGKKTYADVNGIIASKELQNIMSKPSIRLVVGQMDFSKPENIQALNTRVANAQKLMADGMMLQGQLTQIEKQVPPQMMQLASSEDVLKAKFAEARGIIAKINVMAAGLSKIDDNTVKSLQSDMAKVMQLQVAAQTLQKDISTDTQIAQLKAMMNPTDEQKVQQANQIKQLKGAIAVLESGKNPAGNDLTSAEVKAYATGIGSGVDSLLTSVETTKTLGNSVLGKYEPRVSGLVSGANELSAKLSSVKPEQINGLLAQLKDVQTMFANNKDLMIQVNGMLTDDNAKLISQTAKAVIGLKVDLATNSDNLALLNDLATSTKDMQALVPKIAVVMKDLDTAKPLVDKLNTPETLALIEKSPELATQLKAVQKEIKNSQSLMAMAKDQLTEGNLEKAQALVSSIPELGAGVNKLYDGTNQLASGLGTLNSKMPELADGGNKLKDGAVKLADGSKELTDKLSEGAVKLEDGLKNSSSTMGEFVSDPLTLDTEAINEVKNYGTGFTPYFIPLSLWVGAIMMFFVISPKVEDEFGAGAKSKVAGKYLSYGFIGFLQATLVSAVVLTLGLKPNNIVMYFVFNILMSYTFIAIIQCLISLLGDAGRLIAIVLLILQLTSCAGTFPIEVVPRLFKILKPFMPFTYAVAGLREAISGSDVYTIAHSASVLAAIGVGALIVSMIFHERGQEFQERVEAKKEQAA